jgi:hypothetical protein
LLINRTEFTVKDGTLVIQHGPLPSLPGKRLAVSQIRQIFCDEEARRYRDSFQTGYFVFRLNAVLANGSKLVLAGMPLRRDQVLFVEKDLNQRFGIKKQPVVGEIT